MLMILAQFQKDKEFFLEKLNRDNFKIAVLESLDINNYKGKNLYSVAYRKFLKRKKLDKYEYSNPRFRTPKNTEFNVKTKAKPSGITDPPKTRVEEIKDEIKKDFKEDEDKETTQLKTQTKEDGEFRPVVYDHWTARAIGSVFDAMLAPLRAVWPEMKGLTDEEKESIGEMLLPGFQRYGNETFQYLIFPMIGTAGIIVPKMVKGRKLHKEAEDKKKKKKETDKTTKGDEDRVNKLTCRFCNEMFDSAHIKGHQETCKKRLKEQ